MPKHFFFDLDNTLTRSKSHIAPEHKPILKQLIERADVIVVSGHDEGSIKMHLEDVSGYYVLGQNGNHAEDASGRILWERILTNDQKTAIKAFIKEVERQIRPALPVTDPSDLYADRTSEVAYSLIGHHEDLKKKEAFDPDGKKRLQILAEMEQSGHMQELAAANVEVRIGGTTVLDFFEKGKNKGFNVRELMNTMKWKDADSIYIGDAIFPGGNDETVIGVIPTKGVKDYKETYGYLQSVLSS